MTGPTDPNRTSGGAVGEVTAADRAWQDLAAELAPAKSLTRLDAATGRVVSSVGLVATVLTGLGLVAAGLPVPGAARTAAFVAVVVALVAVLAAVAAQVVTVTRELNTNNL